MEGRASGPGIVFERKAQSCQCFDDWITGRKPRHPKYG